MVEVAGVRVILDRVTVDDEEEEPPQEQRARTKNTNTIAPDKRAGRIFKLRT
jgi:hypothetical protein